MKMYRLIATSLSLALGVLSGSTAATELPEEDATRAKMIASPSDDVAQLSAEGFTPEQAWSSLGCVGCHGDDGIFREEILGALGKPVEQVARWIKNAPSIDPDTDMPSFDDVIDEPESVLLARWVLARAERLAKEDGAR
jgi:mono/diheme cytochrome c family protein